MLSGHTKRFGFDPQVPFRPKVTRLSGGSMTPCPNDRKMPWIAAAIQIAVGLLLCGGPFANRRLLAADSPAAPAGKMLLIVAPRNFQEPLQPYIQFKQQY